MDSPVKNTLCTLSAFSFLGDLFSSQVTAIGVSSTFIAGNYKMIGEKNRIGFIYDEDIGFKPHQVNKYMWHFWGEQEELEGALKVIGKNTNTGEEITVFENMALGEPLNDADAHVPSLMSLPSSGIWELNAYIGDELFGPVVVECS